MTNIYCVTHKPIELPAIPGLHALQVGDLEQSFADYRDNDACSIADKNPTWSENTGFYWVWKNRRAESVGFCHYRRFLLPELLKERLQDQLESPYDESSGKGMRNYASGFRVAQAALFDELARCGDAYQQAFGGLLEQADIILPKANQLPPGGFLGQYTVAHPAWPFFEMLALLSKQDNRLARSAYEFFAFHKTAHWNNLFVTRWELFDRYCDFLFPLLFELEKKISLPADPYQQRVFAFLSERLLNFWIWKENLTTLEIDWCMTEAIDEGSEAHQRKTRKK
ncbi:MAG: DUF4422 domain-containing protein [Gammaproteobacteria bacterium]|nr:DUF4422 domain-containing protein [Gammaproteobacteria bacterium]